MGFVLDDLTERGLPVDRERQRKLRQWIEWQELLLQRELQSHIPPELLPTHPKGGYKALPRDLRAALKEVDAIEKKQGPLHYLEKWQDICNRLGYESREFEQETEEGEWYSERRLVKVLPFNASSSDQLLSYIRHKEVHDVAPKRWYVPRHIDTLNPTTGKEALETLIQLTDDPVLKLTQRLRKLSKLGGTYCSGYWVPGPDGCVHGEFRFGTASGQTSCSRPNIQQFPEHYDPSDSWVVELMHKVKGTIRALPGHVFVKTDLRAFHARMQGFLSEDPAYYRMANFDPHSYVTAYYVGEPDAGSLMSLSDEQLRPRLKEIKTAHTHERNAKVKRTLFLMQFGGGADKMFRILNGGGFVSVVEVQQLMDLIKNLFPKTFKDFPKVTRRLLAQHPRLISPFNCIRWFWDLDAEQGTAFRVSNSAHCHVQERLVTLYEAGHFAHFNAVNFAHDALWSMPRVEDARDCRSVVTAEFERPSDVLVNSLGAFQVAADTQWGESMDEMEDM